MSIPGSPCKVTDQIPVDPAPKVRNFIDCRISAFEVDVCLVGNRRIGFAGRAEEISLRCAPIGQALG
jgi:hypothetical protein